MPMEIMTITAPAYWASALINNDYSGMDMDETAALHTYLDPTFEEGWSIVSTAEDEDGEPREARFTWAFDLYGGTARGGDVIDYIAIRAKG